MALRLAIRRKFGYALQSTRTGVLQQPGWGSADLGVVRRSLSSGFQAAVDAAKARPLVTAVVFATTKGVLADLLAQLVAEKRSLRQAMGGKTGHPRDGGGDKAAHPEASFVESDWFQTVDEKGAYDWRRTAAMATFSGMYCGLFFYWQFAVLFPRIWPVVEGAKRSWRTVLQQVAVDNFLFSTCLYMPVFYLTRGAIVNHEPPTASLERYREDFPEVVSCLLKIWVPAGLVNFTFSPVWFRTPFNSIVSFFYLTILSMQSQSLAKK
mmetsp:Transcript_68997/g.180844  ORF Transcript_68997/g.180844 Transcript_68997/m.180844 type:complete len:266 (+) Transcript_68997:244-1041(+)